LPEILPYLQEAYPWEALNSTCDNLGHSRHRITIDPGKKKRQGDIATYSHCSAYQYQSTLMQLLFSFECSMRAEKKVEQEKYALPTVINSNPHV
jgi:hypothetical protein